MLILIGGQLVALIQFFIGSGLNRFLIRNLFTVERKTKANTSQPQSQTLVNRLKRALSLRKPARFSVLANCKSSMRYEKGLSRIDDSLDIVSFIKKQMRESVMKRLLFTKFEKFMINRQQKPFVLKQNFSSDDSDDLNESDFFDKIQ